MGHYFLEKILKTVYINFGWKNKKIVSTYHVKGFQSTVKRKAVILFGRDSREIYSLLWMQEAPGLNPSINNNKF